MSDAILEIDPRYEARWNEYRWYSCAGIFLIPIAGVVMFLISRAPDSLGLIRLIGTIVAAVVFVGCGVCVYAKLCLVRCPRCEGMFFPMRRRFGFLADRCACCGLRKGALNSEDRYL
jgi:hypothetical protein